MREETEAIEFTYALQRRLARLIDQVPETGAIVAVSFPKAKGGSGFPARVFAILPSLNKLIAAAIGAVLLLSLSTIAQAGSATWDLNPASGDWNTAANWTPMTVPNGFSHTARFGLSNTTSVLISSPSATQFDTVAGITFTPAATNPFTITALAGNSPSPINLYISGGGIINNSGITQNFVTTVGPGNFFGEIFLDRASAGSSTTFTNNGGAVNALNGGLTAFFKGSASNASFINNGGTANDAGGGRTFLNSTDGANGTFINNGGTVSGALGGGTILTGASDASNGIFTNNGGAVGGAGGGVTDFRETSTSSNATLIANGGTGGGQGGKILFEGNSTGGTSRVKLFGNGNLDISLHFRSIEIGSVEGNGNVFLGSRELIVGSNNLSATFDGVIQDGGRGGSTGGSLTKIGSGILALTGSNTYTGNTNVKGGVLQVNGSITSNTFVNHNGTLAGSGTVSGNVTNHGTVSPGGDSLGMLTIEGNYAQKRGTLVIDLAGSSAGQFSVLDVLGNANLSGLLNPVLLDGFVPTIGESFTFLDYASLTGTLFIHDRNIDDAMEHWVISYQPNSAVLTVASGNVSVPDQGPTFLLLTLGLVGVATYQSQRTKRIGAASCR